MSAPHPTHPATGQGSGDAADVPPQAESRRSGTEVIQAYLKHLPSSPGVYRMIDANNDVIYVGKARSLKARVSNYTRLGGHTNRIARMIAAGTFPVEKVITARIDAKDVVAKGFEALLNPTGEHLKILVTT